MNIEEKINATFEQIAKNDIIMEWIDWALEQNISEDTKNFLGEERWLMRKWNNYNFQAAVTTEPEGEIINE